MNNKLRTNQNLQNPKQRKSKIKDLNNKLNIYRSRS